MNTNANYRFPLTISNGPGRELLVDTFRLQYLESDLHPRVELKLSRDFIGDGRDPLRGAVLRVEVRVEFRPMLLQYEDGSGQSFSIGGYVGVNGNKGESVVYMEGHYNTHTRKGVLWPASESEYRDSWLKQYIDGEFLAKSEEWKKKHK